jgi:hypothetical protein
MARKRQTMTEYNATSFKEVDNAIINETNKGNGNTNFGSSPR